MLVFCVGALTALGMVMLCSASTGEAEAHYLVMQPIWCVGGLIAFVTLSCVNYEWVKKHPWLIWCLLGLSLVLLSLVWAPKVGLKANGAQRWIGWKGSFRIQPSELAKLALILTLAWYGDRYQRYMHQFWRGFVIPGLLIVPVVALVFLEPDVGTAILLTGISSMILLMAGIRWRYFLPPVCLVAVLGAAYLHNNQMRSERIYSWLHLEETKQDKGMQAYQAMVALGSGGLTGLGLGNGRQKLGFVPEHHTDFILSVMGEELGLLATLAVIVGFVSIIVAGIYIALNAADTFGMLLSAGLTFLIAIQAAVNIGVVTGALPNKGLSLPFISYGGSNLVIMFSCIGLMISVARQARSSVSAMQMPAEGWATNPG